MFKIFFSPCVTEKIDYILPRVTTMRAAIKVVNTVPEWPRGLVGVCGIPASGDPPTAVPICLRRTDARISTRLSFGMDPELGVRVWSCVDCRMHAHPGWWCAVAGRAVAVLAGRTAHIRHHHGGHVEGKWPPPSRAVRRPAAGSVRTPGPSVFLAITSRNGRILHACALNLLSCWYCIP